MKTNFKFGNLFPRQFWGKMYHLDGYFGLFLTNVSELKLKKSLIDHIPGKFPPALGRGGFIYFKFPLQNTNVCHVVIKKLQGTGELKNAVLYLSLCQSMLSLYFP